MFFCQIELSPVCRLSCSTRCSPRACDCSSHCRHQTPGSESGSQRLCGTTASYRAAPAHLPGPLGPAPCPRSRGGFLCSAEQRDAIRSTAWAPACPTCLLEIVQAMLVAVGDVEGIEVLQGTSLIRQPHGGDAFQDLIQLLLTRGLKRAEKTERQITQCNPKSV